MELRSLDGIENFSASKGEVEEKSMQTKQCTAEKNINLKVKKNGSTLNYKYTTITEKQGSR